MINNIHKYIKLAKQNSMFHECKIYRTIEYFSMREQFQKMLSNYNYIQI